MRTGRDRRAGLEFAREEPTEDGLVLSDAKMANIVGR
jgi:hypothetical protein